jgi:hypothetical protein
VYYCSIVSSDNIIYILKHMIKKGLFLLLFVVGFLSSEAQISSLDSNQVTLNFDTINGCMSIEFNLISSDTLTLTVYNRWGAIDTLFLQHKHLTPGFYSYKFIPKDSIEGTYVYSLTNTSESDNGTIIYAGKPAVIADSKKEYELNVWPNPAQNTIYIDHSFQGKTLLTITTIDGKRTQELDISYNRLIDISFYKKGVYVMTLQNGVDTFSKKLIKN